MHYTRNAENYTMPIYRTERLIIIRSFFPSVHNLNFNSLDYIDQIVACMTIFFFHIIFIILLEIVLELFVIRYYRHYCNPDPVFKRFACDLRF